MSNPTFNGIDLTSQAPRTVLGCRRSRASTESIPGVNGLFIQPLGAGGRKIHVSGLLSSISNCGVLARRDVLAAFRDREILCDGRTVADFVDSDGITYLNCTVTGVSHGPIQIVRQGDLLCLAYMPINVELLQLTP